jgi:SAM-dependent methyltransferase
MNESLNNLYNHEAAPEWGETKTMEHASGIWGREPMLAYLAQEVLKKGDKVLDIGCGAGYPSARMAEQVGEDGRVVGLEYSKAMLGIDAEDSKAASEKYKELKQLSFINADATEMPLKDKSFDAATSFMVLHNLDISKVQEVFGETQRILKDGGKAVFLTMHPDVLEAKWDVDFMKYDEGDLTKYRESQEKEGLVVHGRVKNAGGGEKDTAMVVHTRENIIGALEKAGLTLVGEKELPIDEDTAREKFGSAAVRKLPKVPAFWMLVVEKKLERPNSN